MNTKMKMTALAGAVALMAAMPAANAAIAQFNTGNGELFFNIEDQTNGVSYTRDLGIFLNDFTPSTATSNLTIPPDALLTSTFGTTLSSGLRYSILAGDSIGFNPQTLRYLSTTPSSITTVQQLSDGALANMRVMDQFIQGVNNGDTNVALNTSSVWKSGDPGFFDPSSETWAGNTNFNNSQDIGSPQSMYFLTNSQTMLGAGLVAKVLVTQFPGSWDLKTDGTLSYAVSGPAPVPLPAAAWLMASGLVGLVGVARRRNRV